MKSEKSLVVTAKIFFFRVRPYKCCIKAKKFQAVALGYLKFIDLSLDGKEAGPTIFQPSIFPLSLKNV